MNPQKIIEIVCKDFNCPPESVQLDTNKQHIVQPRQICHFFTHSMTNLTDTYIGELIGNKDRCTVIHSRKTVLNLMETDREYRERIQRIEMQLMIEALKEYQPKLTMNSYPERKQLFLTT